MKRGINLKKSILDFLGGAGYIAALFQWLWVVAVFLPSIVAAPVVQEFLGHPETKPVQPSIVAHTSSAAMNPLVTFLGIAVAVAFLSWILYTLVTKIPRSIARSGETITHKPAAVLSPIVVKHMHLTPKEKRAVPSWFIVAFKFLIIFVPLCLLVFAMSLTLAVSFEVVMVIGVVLFSWSFLSFSAQLLLARFWKVDYQTVR